MDRSLAVEQSPADGARDSPVRGPPADQGVAMDDDGAATRAIAAAHTRTRAAGSARIELLTDFTFEMPPTPGRWRGMLLRPMISVARAAGRRLLKAVAPGFDFRHQTAEGVIDLLGRRYMLDYGSYARLYADGREWEGRSGRLLATLPPNAQELPSPLWLLDILADLTGATEEGTEDVRGTVCRRFRANVDLSRAAKVTPGGVAVWTVGRFDGMLTLPVELCLDDEHVRRVRVLPEHGTETLELWDFGVSLGGLDWSRLPTFRSPEEAAEVAKVKRPG